jgi:hypothetical protein
VDVFPGDVITESVFHAEVFGFNAVSHFFVPGVPLIFILLFLTVGLFPVSSTFRFISDVHIGVCFSFHDNISLISLRVKSFIAADIIEWKRDFIKDRNEPGGFMAVAMKTLMGEYEAIVWIDDEDDFEEITSFDFASYPFNVGKTRFCLEKPCAVDDGVGS